MCGNLEEPRHVRTGIMCEPGFQFDRVVVAVLTDSELTRGGIQEMDMAPEKLDTFFADGQARGEG